MKSFIIIGSSGYVAPRHLDAIKSLVHNLMAAIDPSDSAGILDSYFPSCKFFCSTDESDEWYSQQSDLLVDFVTICSPNHLVMW